MSKRRRVLGAVCTAMVPAVGVAGALWRAEQSAKTEKQELDEVREEELKKARATLEKLERRLAEAVRKGSKERLELQRMIEEERLRIEDYPPQYRPQPRPYLDPSRNPPKQ